MNFSIISFRANRRIEAKFQTDRLRTFDKNRAEKDNKNMEIAAIKSYTLAAATLRGRRQSSRPTVMLQNTRCYENNFWQRPRPSRLDIDIATKDLTMNFCTISFRTNWRIVAKFQADRLSTFDEKHTIAAAAVRYACGVNKAGRR